MGWWTRNKTGISRYLENWKSSTSVVEYWLLLIITTLLHKHNPTSRKHLCHLSVLGIDKVVHCSMYASMRAHNIPVNRYNHACIINVDLFELGLCVYLSKPKSINSVRKTE